MKKRWILFLTLAAVSPLADPPDVTFSPELRWQLDAALQSQGANYRPRTRHLHPDGRAGRDEQRGDHSAAGTAGA